MPGVGLEPSFLEEPVMLLAIVLLGRTLEARARLRATGELALPCHVPKTCCCAPIAFCSGG